MRCRTAGLILATWVATSGAARAVDGPVDCRVSSSGLSFGRVAAHEDAPLDAVALVSITCEGEGTARVEVELTTTSGDGRVVLADGTAAPAALLFLDPARTVLWGSRAGAGVPLVREIAADGKPHQVPVYGVLDVGAGVVAGRYDAQLSLAVQADRPDAP